MRSPLRSFNVERSRYASLENAFRVRVQHLLTAHLRGDFDYDAAGQRMSVLLKEFHRAMFFAGRRSVGNCSPHLSTEEQRALHGYHSVDMRYFWNFLRNIRDQKGRMPYQQRMDLYALGGYSVYLRGAILGVAARDPKNVRWHWQLNKHVENCVDCQARHTLSVESGGLTYETLLKIGLPGERTACGHRCMCSLKSEFGVSLKRTRPTTYKHSKHLNTKMVVKLFDEPIEHFIIV